MSMDYDVIVVGGGMAGLSAMAYLCKYGYHALLCEKRNKTGGLVDTFYYNGFAFDAGIRAFENSGIIFPMLKNLDIQVDFINNPVSIGVGNECVRVNTHESIQAYRYMLATLFPQNIGDIDEIIKKIQRVMDYLDVIYGIDNPLFLDNVKDPKYLTKTLLPWLVKYNINMGKINHLDEPVNVYLKHFTGNQALIDMITQHFFKDTPAFFALSYFALYLNYYYPKGGTGELAHKITDYILAAGGEIMTQTAVSHIDVPKREISTADNKLYRYNKLVWAADQKALYSAIKMPQSTRIKKQRSLVEKSKGGDSVLTLFLGVDLGRDYFERTCGPHSFYTPTAKGLSSLTKWEPSASMGKEELTRWVVSYLALTTYEISCPALMDDSLAPEGKTGVIVSTLMDYQLVQHFVHQGNYEYFKEFCIDTILNTLDASLFPTIKKHTIFALCSTPITIERETGSTQGAITGWSFTNDKIPSQKGFKKIMHSVETPIQDIYQCGQWTFSPSGLPVSLFTGKVAADKVRKKLKKAHYE